MRTLAPCCYPFALRGGSRTVVGSAAAARAMSSRLATQLSTLGTVPRPPLHSTSFARNCLPRACRACGSVPHASAEPAASTEAAQKQANEGKKKGVPSMFALLCAALEPLRLTIHLSW